MTRLQPGREFENLIDNGDGTFKPKSEVSVSFYLRESPDGKGFIAVARLLGTEVEVTSPEGGHTEDSALDMLNAKLLFI